MFNFNKVFKKNIYYMEFGKYQIYAKDEYFMFNVIEDMFIVDECELDDFHEDVVYKETYESVLQRYVEENTEEYGWEQLDLNEHELKLLFLQNCYLRKGE